MPLAKFTSVALGLVLVLPALAQAASPAADRPASGEPGIQSGLDSNPYHRSGGFYSEDASGISGPTFGVPRSIGDGYFRVPSGSVELPMWQAPSGYLYPWAPRPEGFKYGYQLPILVVRDSTPSPAMPPLVTIFSDMGKYLDRVQKDKKIKDSDYTLLKKRVNDLQSKARRLRVSGSGRIDSGDEAELRRSVDDLGRELSFRVKP